VLYCAVGPALNRATVRSCWSWGNQALANRASRQSWKGASAPSLVFACAISAHLITRTVRSTRSPTSSSELPGSCLMIPPAARLEKLEALLARAAPPDEDVAFILDLLSLPSSDRHKLPNLSPQRIKERTLQALLRQLEGLARKQPVLMVFEDAHWIDPTSRELLDLTIERMRSLPVLLIVTFRPEFQPPWTGQPQVTMLTLNRLDRRDRSTLVAQVAEGNALPDEVVDQIVDRTDGVPLFIEELTKSVLESGVPPVGIPTTLHDSLMARLDRLAPVRLVAQIGAAIGRQFSYVLLRAVSDLPEEELRGALARLVASELVFERGMPPDAVYTFKHALVEIART